jgi:hypothetical protein
MKPRSINIFLLDGDPDGVKVAQIAMSTIQAIAFRRNQLRRVRGSRTDTVTPRQFSSPVRAFHQPRSVST